jgi:hypothetical protein
MSTESIAAPVTLTLDPVLSSITLSGSVQFGAVSLPLLPQGPGANVTTYSGLITVDVDNPFAPTTIQALGSNATAAISGNWLPQAGGGPAPGNPGVAQPANYGVLVTAGALSAYGAGRNIVFDITSGVEPVVAGAFASNQTLTFDTGQFAVNTPLAGGNDELDLSGISTPNAAAASSYIVVGSLATLTIPISGTVVDGDLTTIYTGLLVATARVPEPASAVVAGTLAIGLIGFSAIRRWR